MTTIVATQKRTSNNQLSSSSSDDDTPLFSAQKVVKTKVMTAADVNVAQVAVAQTDAEELAVALQSIRIMDTRVEQDSAGSFTSYEVVTQRENGEVWSVWRRYREFEVLHKFLIQECDAESRGEIQQNLPLPPRKWFGHMDSDFVAKRRVQLAFYCSQLLAVRDIGKRSLALRSFLKPSLRVDWPASFGPIDLNLHDLPHASSVTEWWYFNSHLGRFSVFVCFFRILKHEDKKTGARSYAHALNWAISDTETKKYHCEVILDRDSPKMVLDQLKNGSRVIKDATIREAMVEMLENGNVPLPDKMFKSSNIKFVSHSRAKLNFENATMVKNESGAYILEAKADGGNFGLNLSFAPVKPAVRHGQNGVVMGKDGDDMFYYFIPRCNVTGSLSVEGENFTVRGDGWYDHEFGGALPKEGERRMDYAWNWASAQLSNQHEITAAVLIDPKTGTLMETRAVIIDPEGNVKRLEDLTFEPAKVEDAIWRSVRTYRSYPVRWILRVPAAQIELAIDASFPDQEFMTLISKPAFWEGRCDVSGTFNGESVTGYAYVERNGFDEMPKLMDFFKAVGKEVRKSVQHMYPDEPTFEQARDLIADKDTEHYMKGVPLDVFQKTLLQPVRDIADRGGKSWRSYAALACCDVVGGDSRNFVEWLAMPEFMHVGSLIVDDIQDESKERRGGPSAHLIHGEPICINAGTAAYFMCEHLIKAPGLSEKTLNRVYQLYFSCLRGGHAGQALDIHGLDYLMPEAIESGDSSILEERSLAIHMLKTAVPAGTLARMGALVGGGTDAQVESIGLYFESVGLAFQIMDDVLNLRGLYFGKADKNANSKKSLKVIGEDIMAGKVTMPIAKAISRMDKAERVKLWDTVKSKPQDPAVVTKVIADLEAVGAIDACVEQANELVEGAWRNLNKAVPDSFSKMMLRSFGWFVVRR